MAEQTNIESLKQTFSTHLKSSSPISKSIVIDGVNVVEFESYICGLIATFVGFEGEIKQINKHYFEVGSINDFCTMLKLSRSRLEELLPSFFGEKLAYLNTVLQMLKEIDHLLEQKESFNLTKTGDIDEELSEFRKALKARENNQVNQ